MMKVFQTILIASLGFIIIGNVSNSYALDFTYEDYIPKWAIPMDETSALSMCGTITHETVDHKWCNAFGSFVNSKWKETTNQNTSEMQVSKDIPLWIRNNAEWWAASLISDKDFVKGLEYLIQKGILQVPTSTKVDSASSEQIPSWLRNNASWWSQGLLSDDEFVKGIQYLTSNGIINVSQNNLSCLGNGLCISARVEKIVDGDTIYVEGYKVRLSLTNTPEKNEFGFLEATEFTKNLCPVDSIITIDQDDEQLYDAYGRLLGKVYCGDKMLNSELLYNGHANILSQYCPSSEFSNESWAQKYGCDASQESKQIHNTPNTTQSIENCDPSYPDICIPSYPPDLNCKDIPFKKFRVLPPDPHRFDGDKDGIGCES